MDDGFVRLEISPPFLVSCCDGQQAVLVYNRHGTVLTSGWVSVRLKLGFIIFMTSSLGVSLGLSLVGIEAGGRYRLAFSGGAAASKERGVAVVLCFQRKGGG